MARGPHRELGGRELGEAWIVTVETGRVVTVKALDESFPYIELCR